MDIKPDAHISISSGDEQEQFFDIEFEQEMLA